jgi:DNA-3-methyladenine glycosylase II
LKRRLWIEPSPPYSLALTAARYARFPDPVDHFDGKTYRRLLEAGRSVVLVTVEMAGGVTAARLRVTLEGPAAASEAAVKAARRLVEGALGAEADVKPFYRAARADPLLAPLVRKFRGLRIAGYPSLWEAIVTAIFAQQVNLAFAFDIRADFATTFGKRLEVGGHAYYAFPSAKRIAREGESGLDGFRLSRSKRDTIARLSRAFAEGELQEGEIAALPDEGAIERLTAWKGVGRWTAETALLRGLARADAYPAGDLSVVKYLPEAVFEHGRRASESEMRAYGERWRPWRGLALTYCWTELAGVRSPRAPRDGKR